MAPDAVASLYMVNPDCADPRRMASFYSALLGWETPYCEDEYSMVSNGSTSIGFGRIDDYTPPPWPDEQHAKQYHLDFRVEDLAQAEATSLELGATVPEFQPGGDRWRVFLDPGAARSASFPPQPSPERGRPAPHRRADDRAEVDGQQAARHFLTAEGTQVACCISGDERPGAPISGQQHDRPPRGAEDSERR